MKIVTRNDLIQKLEQEINCKIVHSLPNPERLEIAIKKKSGYHRYLLDSMNLYSDSADHILNKKMKDNIELLKQIRDWQLSEEERDYLILNTNLSEVEIFNLYGISYPTQRAVRNGFGNDDCTWSE